MPVNIHGKQYVTVAERVQAVHEDRENKTLSIMTELITNDPVLVKATVITSKGTFTGYSAANPAKAIEKQSPYEVAETSAIGRALGFAGYGVIDGIATADEMSKGGYEMPKEKPEPIWYAQKQTLEAYITAGVIADSLEMRKRIDGLTKKEADEWIQHAKKKEAQMIDKQVEDVAESFDKRGAQ